MDFASYAFAFLYLAALAIRFSIGRSGGVDRRYLAALVLLSLVFYGWHIPAHLLLLVAIVSLHYAAARLIHRERDGGGARKVLVTALLANILVLAVFKYADLLLDWVLRPVGTGILNANSLPESFAIALPIAISFYTFQTISYTVDVYRGRIAPEQSFLRFLFYVILFPQLIAGPIVRAWELLYQLNRARRPSGKVFLWGGYLIVRGVFLKLVVADNLDTIVDRFWGGSGKAEMPTHVVWSLAFFYSVQLLCDFMAYTDIARGVAYQLGFRLPINFNAPYIASSFTDFWRRWHMTLSRWFKDYLFVLPGGSRYGTPRLILSTMLVFLLSGLWHGADATFLAWGAILGIALVTEKLVAGAWKNADIAIPAGFTGSIATRCGRVTWYLVVQLVWILSLVLFRSENFDQAIVVLRDMFELHRLVEPNGKEQYHDVMIGWGLVIPVLLMHVRAYLAERFSVLSVPRQERYVYAGIMLALSCTLYASPRSFIYFQF